MIQNPEPINVGKKLECDLMEFGVTFDVLSFIAGLIIGAILAKVVLR